MADQADELGAGPVVRHVADVVRTLAHRVLLFAPGQQRRSVVPERVQVEAALRPWPSHKWAWA